MYLGIDIGGTKTLVASFDDQGNPAEEVKFPTDKDYPTFLEDLRKTLAGLSAKEFRSCAAGVPGVIDRSAGTGISFGNLPWKNVPIQDDIATIAGCPTAIENDAKLAGLSEAALLPERSVLYITVSTGIGYSLIVDKAIDTSFGDAGGRALLLEHDGKMTPWEDFASGRAIVERYGKKAVEITDEATWRAVADDLAQGLIQLIAVAQPEVIVIGGAVGTQFEKYGALVAEALGKYEVPMVTLPRVAGAKRPEEAVIYGCYELMKGR